MTGSAAGSAVTRQAEAAKPEKLGATERLKVISAPGIDELGQAPEVSKSALLTEKVQFSVWNEEKTALLTETEDGSAALYALPGENLDGGVLLRWDDTLVNSRGGMLQITALSRNCGCGTWMETERKNWW